jgi:hypothetical protein
MHASSTNRRTLNPDVISTYTLRIEALSTIIIVGALLFGFAAAMPPSSTPVGSSPNITVSLLITLTLAFSSFALAVSSALVYQMLNLTSDAAISAMDAHAHLQGPGASDEAHAAIDGSLREVIDDYIVGTNLYSVLARAALLASFVTFLFATGVERAWSMTSFGQSAMVATLLAGAAALGYSLLALRRRSSFCYEKLHNVCTSAGVSAHLASLTSPRRNTDFVEKSR